ncbi:DUF551 domain-containing protein [Raoultella terrigena]
MSTITKELAKLFRKITNSEIDAEGNAHVVLSPADSLLINNARIALASLEAEPVAFVKSGYALCYYRPPSEYGLKIGDKLYAAAQPATVVPDEQHSERFDWTLGQWAEHVGGRHQGDDPANYYEFGSFMAVAAMLRQFGIVQQKLGWNACRAAMLQGKAEPVSLHPELSVWYGSMPESNGKSNWTAILHRKGERLSTGITIELSEYPERVRYEADRVRHIIGELKEEPDILAYDADEHSGYVKPGNSPVIPDGSADMLRRWLAFGRGMQNAGCQLPHNLIAESEAMLAAAPHDTPALNSVQSVVTVPGKWITVSERIPETDGNYWGWWSESKRQGPVWFIKSELQAQFQSHEITHWMPLPNSPQEAK